MPTRGHDELADAQARLARAMILGRVDDRLGIEPIAQERASRVVRTKRERVIAASWPDLRDALGDRFPTLVADYAAAGLPRLAQPGQDAHRFARWLDARDDLPDVLVRGLITRDLASGVRLRVQRIQGGLILGLRLPGGRTRVLTLGR